MPKALLGSSNKRAHAQQPPATSNANYLSMKRVNHVVMNSMLNNAAATHGSGTDLAAASDQQK